VYSQLEFPGIGISNSSVTLMYSIEFTVNTAFHFMDRNICDCQHLLKGINKLPETVMCLLYCHSVWVSGVTTPLIGQILNEMTQ